MTRKAQKVTNRAVWTFQSLLALLFVFAGSVKFMMPPEKMQGPIALPLAFTACIFGPGPFPVAASIPNGVA